MHADTLKDLIHAKSFQAFTLHLADGHTVDVPHPDFILLTRGGRTAIVSTGGEHIEILDVALVTHVTGTKEDVAAD